VGGAHPDPGKKMIKKCKNICCNKKIINIKSYILTKEKE